jgi:peptidoglycan/xylan/chitin deacetylase (PgdA/CDA1 family)
MSNYCTIVAYHYVRELSETRFPRIKGLNLSHFKEQLAYMHQFYKFVTVQDCIESIHTGAKLPSNAALLTFDDGYIDHYNKVFPILDSAGIQGCFFPPVAAIKDGRVLDVNKIHFILASSKSMGQLKSDIFNLLDLLRSDGHEIMPNKELYEKLAFSSGFDQSDVVFIKKLLQRELSQRHRTYILDKLFKSYVSDNEISFARELYLSEDQIRTMDRHGMVIGSHGYNHLWMDTLSKAQQKIEVESSLEFLQSVGVSIEDWAMCYPYGAHNESLRSICSKMGCSIGFTTVADIAEINQKNALLLPRLDTNHLPKKSSEGPNNWTNKIIKAP